MTSPIAWPEAQRICDIPEVREALDKFAADAHEENMLAMVSAIMGHASAQGRAAGLEEAADPMPDCPRCNGSGEEEVMDGDGPDAHPIMVNCTHCGGVGSLSAAYKHLLVELDTANRKYLDACGKLYFANLSPIPSDAGKDDARDAALEEAIRDAIAENMTGLYYCCRTWSAWNVGTMSQNDFWPAGDDDEIIQNITDGVIAALSSLEVIGKGEKG